MAKPQGNKSAPPPKPAGSRLWTGLMVGMLFGVGMAAILAWYVMKAPSPFLQKSLDENKPAVANEKPLPSAPEKKPQTSTTDTASASSKPRFDFYNVLTNKQDSGVVAPAKPSKKSSNEVAQVLQAGSFSNVDDAEKLKAKLAMLGAEASVQTAAIPDKGVWYRVRLGPYKNTDDLNHARTFLKQNGIESTPMRAQ
jgi:cell division protein FtsN